ncbi:histidine kinase [Aggregatilineales bacterium SYSU G02658]
MAFQDDLTNTGSNPVEELTTAISAEMATTRRRLTEVKSQLDQMQLQVDREQMRYSGIAAEIRNIKENLDTVPREDIRDKYDEALEARFRLATMRGQLEKIESIYNELESRQSLMNLVISKLQGAESLPASIGDNGVSGNLDVVGIINAQEDERMRLSRAIHDSIAQALTNFILQSEICQRLFDRNPERAAEELNNLKLNANNTFQKVREFIFDLRPMMLDDLGVAPTVRKYLDNYRDKNDIETQVTILGEERRLENYREVLIFRSIQDLLISARDYASPTAVNVTLDLTGNRIKVTVEDDGRAFDTSKVTARENDTNDARVQTLRMLKSKLELIGGSMQLNSSDNEGSSIRLEIPSGE